MEMVLDDRLAMSSRTIALDASSGVVTESQDQQPLPSLDGALDSEYVARFRVLRHKKHVPVVCARWSDALLVPYVELPYRMIALKPVAALWHAVRYGRARTTKKQ